MIGYGVSGLMLFLAAYASSCSIAVGALSLSIACLMSAESSFWSSAVYLAEGKLIRHNAEHPDAERPIKARH